MKYYLWVFISVFYFGLADEAKAYHEDSTRLAVDQVNIEVLEFDRDMLDAFRSDSDFQYIQPPSARPNFLKMLIKKFLEWLIFIFGNEIVAWAVLIIIVILGLVGLGFALYGIFGIGKTFPVYNRDQEGLDYTVNKENIHELNFNEEIDSAVASRNYKKAIRMTYLYALKLLADKNMIDWQPAKTNHDYAYEIKDVLSQDYFLRLGYYFEYVWYGDFNAEESHYRSVYTAMTELKKNLHGDD